MNEDKKKVNSGNGTQKPHDNITDGFYDLTEVYSGVPENPKAATKKLTREEALKLRDEKRRELEMQAIAEDIERRYSIQLEQAQNNIDEKTDKPEKTIIDFEADTSVVSEELGRMDELISADVVGGASVVNAPEEGRKTEESDGNPEPKKKTAPVRTSSFDDGEIYGFIYFLGDSVLKTVLWLVSLVTGFFRFCFKKLGRAFDALTIRSRNKAREYARSTLREIVFFRREIKSAGVSLKKALHNPKSLPAVLMHYIRKAFVRHKQLLKTAVNVAMPVLSAFILIVTVAHWSGVTFALEVFYNEKSIGYIVDESVYIEAKDIVKDRLSGGGISDGISDNPTVSADLNADYKIAVVSIEELNDAQAISDKMIENSVDSLTNACGVYIDGRFICAVKNEADAKTVFYNILEPYEAQADEEGYVVGFAQNIDYVQGLYKDDPGVMWEASALAEKLSEPSEEAVIHTAREDDTLSSIAEEYGVSEDELVALNPDYDFENIGEGDSITVERSFASVNIKKTVTTSEIREIKYDTVKKKDSSKYSSYKRVEQKGVNGSERVIKTKIYIDGELADTKYDYETIVEPVDEIVTVGTKTYYDGVYVGSPSDSGFLWPAPSCHYVSSPYGWRSSGWHNGIDLVKSGGGANGTPVIASRSGTVEVVQRSNSGYGNMVLINHGDGYKTRYAHMISGSITVRTGDYVEAGRTIGRVGSTGNSTGPHLHFEVIYRGETQNPKYYIYN